MRIIIEVEEKETEVKEMQSEKVKDADLIIKCVDRIEHELARFGQSDGYPSAEGLLNYIKLQVDSIRRIADKK